jgi:hypothetical protein
MTSRVIASRLPLRAVTAIRPGFSHISRLGAVGGGLLRPINPATAAPSAFSQHGMRYSNISNTLYGEGSSIDASKKNILPEFSLKGKVIVVSGAAQGLGLALSEALIEAGATGKYLSLGKVTAANNHPHSSCSRSSSSTPNRRLSTRRILVSFTQ